MAIFREESLKNQRVYLFFKNVKSCFCNTPIYAVAQRQHNKQFKAQTSPSRWAQLVERPSSSTKGLQVRSLVWVAKEATDPCFSHIDVSLSPFLSLKPMNIPSGKD